MNKIYNNKNTSFIEYENINYKTSNLTNSFFQGYKVQLYKLIGGLKTTTRKKHAHVTSNETFKQVLSVFEVKAENWQKFKTMFINDLIGVETKYYFIDDTIVRGN